MSSCEEVWITDFQPAAGEGTELTPYRLEGRRGRMLRLRDEDEEIRRLVSPYQGWCEIHLGFIGASGIRLRLAGESCFRWVECSVQWERKPGEGEEAFWKIAEVTGAGFEFLPQLLARRADQRQSQIAYLRLVPLTAEEARGRRDIDRKTGSAGAVIDGHEMFGSHSPQSPEEVRGMLEPYVDSDFDRIHFGCTCTSMRVVYPTEVGYFLGQGQAPEELHSDANRRCAAALKRAVQEGWDPIEVMIDYCRENGLEFWADFRIQQDYPYDYAGGFGSDFNSPFTKEHQEWRHVDRNGEVCSHLFSHFHPGWEQYKLDLLAELARKGPAGIHLNLMCEMEAIWDFEPGAAARCREEYGVDPTETDEPPEEWYQFRCDHLTEFVRRLRRQTDEISEGLGRKIEIAVQVSGEWAILKQGKLVKAVAQNFLAGFNVGRWAREGLVDAVSPSFRRTYKPMFLEHLWEELGDAREKVKVIPSIGQHDNAIFPRGYEWSLYFTDGGKGRTDLVPFGELDAWRVLREAHDLYQQGADAVDVWEMGHAPTRLDRWNVLGKIGDREMLEREFGKRVGGLMGEPSQGMQFTMEREE